MLQHPRLIKGEACYSNARSFSIFNVCRQGYVLHLCFRKVYLLKAANYHNMVKVEIDLEGCIQCGRCYDEACSDIFVQTDDGTSNISEKYRTSGPEAGEVPENMFDCAAKAAEECPVDVISIQK